MQIFEGGCLIHEQKSGVFWYHHHSPRPILPLQPGQLLRFPRILTASGDYGLTVFRDRVLLRHNPTGREEQVVPGQPGPPVPEYIQKILKKFNLEQRLGPAVSGEIPLFDGAIRLQVFDGGVILYEPSSKRNFRIWHARRSLGPIEPSGLKEDVRLPGDPQAVVISLDFRGGLTPPRKSPAPYLTIRADGRVTVMNPFKADPPLQFQISRTEIEKLLAFAIQQHQFFQLSSSRLEQMVKAELKRRGKGLEMDAPNTVITIRTADRTHEVRCYAAGIYARILPDFQALQHFQAVARRLGIYLEPLRKPG